MITQITIRQLREFKGFSQVAIAKKLKISQSAYSKLEKGFFKRKEANYIGLAKILEVDVEYLKVNCIPVFIYFDSKNFRDDASNNFKVELIKITLNSIIYQQKLLDRIISEG